MSHERCERLIASLGKCLNLVVEEGGPTSSDLRAEHLFTQGHVVYIFFFINKITIEVFPFMFTCVIF